MSEMNELSELNEESSDLQMDAMPGEKAPWRRRRPSQRPHRGPSPGEQPGQIARPDFESEGEGEEFNDYDSPEEELLNGEGYRVSATLEEANKMFLRTSRAREASLDGGFQMHSGIQVAVMITGSCKL
ncbi:hypothetical protein FD754_009767 [Muntiacus muntjak]|uniref:Uncharacterized protein n=1 Tax=Muntiacus muntjak TaxID=9888 RepID=A0A5N3WVE1_MUNMU|nr:hypothetical protein FD754_009767 [Muntiacus muntjak]